MQIDGPSVAYAKTGTPVSYTLTFSDANLDASTINPVVHVTGTGTANGTAVVSGSGNTRTVDIINLVGNGTISISVDADSVLDQAGHSAAAAGPSDTVIVDNTKPVIQIGAPTVGRTGRGPVSFEVSAKDTPDDHLGTFTLDLAHLAITSAPGVLTGTIGTPVRLSAKSFRVTVTNIQGGSGALRLQVLRERSRTRP